MWMLGWFAAGLGVIIKGVGFLALLMLLPALFAALAWLVARDACRGATGAVLARSAGVPARRVACGWCRCCWRAHGDRRPGYRAYLDDILLRQTATRYADVLAPPPAGLVLPRRDADDVAADVLALPWAIAGVASGVCARAIARYLLPLAWWVLVVVFFTIPAASATCTSCRRCRWLAWRWRRCCRASVRKRGGAARWCLRSPRCLAGVMLAAGLAMLLRRPGLRAPLVAERGIDRRGRGAGRACCSRSARWRRCVPALVRVPRVRCGAARRRWPACGCCSVWSATAAQRLLPGARADDRRRSRIGPDAELGWSPGASRTC